MNLQSLLGFYENDSRVNQLSDALAMSEKAKVQLRGLSGSQASFVAAALFRKEHYHHILVANDKEEAGYFYSDLKNLIENKDILFFPDSFKKPAAFEEVNNMNVLQRSETVNRLNHPASKSEIVLTYPEALIEKVVKPAILDKHTLFIGVNEKFDSDFIAEVLIEYGFDHNDFVYEPGQFSIRGGIVDIFSYANEYPYRVELFDDVVESIRCFDPSTQLSVKKISSVTIVPNLQQHFQPEEKMAMLNLIPANTIWWFFDAALCFEYVEKAKDKVLQLELLKREGKWIPDERHPMFHSATDYFDLNMDLPAYLENCRVVDICGNSVFAT